MQPPPLRTHLNAQTSPTDVNSSPNILKSRQCTDTVNTAKNSIFNHSSTHKIPYRTQTKRLFWIEAKHFHWAFFKKPRSE